MMIAATSWFVAAADDGVQDFEYSGTRTTPTFSDIDRSYGFSSYAKAVEDALDIKLRIPQNYIERKKGIMVYFRTPNTAMHPIEEYSVSIISKDGKCVLLLSGLRVEADMGERSAMTIAERDVCAAVWHETCRDYEKKYNDPECAEVKKLIKEIPASAFNADWAYWVQDLPIDKTVPCEFKRCAGIYVKKQGRIPVMIKVLSLDDGEIDMDKAIADASRMVKYGNIKNWKLDIGKFKNIPRARQ